MPLLLVWGDTGRVALVPVNTATCKTTHTHTSLPPAIGSHKHSNIDIITINQVYKCVRKDGGVWWCTGGDPVTVFVNTYIVTDNAACPQWHWSCDCYCISRRNGHVMLVVVRRLSGTQLLDAMTTGTIMHSLPAGAFASTAVDVTVDRHTRQGQGHMHTAE
jgi:hypothetical protein